MTLDKVKRGQTVKILSIPSETVRAQAIRFGIAEGELVTCQEVVPGGPVVVTRNKQEIAIGRELARSIGVELVSPSSVGENAGWGRRLRQLTPINWLFKI